MKSSIRVVLAYLIAAALWILATDSLILALGIDESTFQLFKGMLFVLVTALVLWVVLSREERLRAAATEDAETHRTALAQREHEYRALFDSNPQPMWVLDEETQAFLAVNQAALDAYGFSRDEFLSMTAADVLAPDEADADRDLLARATCHRTKGGDVLYVDVASNEVHFEGHRGAALVLAHDVTARLEAERALREAKQQVEIIIDTSPVAIILLDRDAIVRLWNPAAERIFGWSANEVIGTPNPIVPDYKAGEFEGAFTGVLTGHPVDGLRLQRRNKAGQTVSVVCFSAAVTGENGEAEAAVGIFADVSDQVRAEEELKRYRERLEELVQARTAELSIVNERLSTATRVKSEFLANMSHELRTPLNSIIGFSGAMLQGLAGELSEEQRKQLGMVYRSGKHLLELINDILDLSKIEAGRFTVEVLEFDVREIVTTVIESLVVQIEASALDVRAVVPETPLLAMTDRTKLRQILINLIGNAIKFTEHGSVEVEVELDDGMLLISVRDTGPGIPQAELASIFDEFTQSKRRADEKPQGTGLGLAISRRLARILCGDIEVSSTVGEGSVFRLRIPSEFRGECGEGLVMGDSGLQGAQ